MKLPSSSIDKTNKPNEDKNDELLEAELNVRQLKETIEVLRDELESLRFEKDAAVQQAVQRSADELEQLKLSISNLRTELDSAQFKYEKDLQQQAVIKLDEHSHLQETIAKLRIELEERHV